MTRGDQRAGFIFLFSVLTLGLLSLATLGSLLLISIGIIKSGDTVRYSEQAFLFANSCAERALRSLWVDFDYGGNEQFIYENGECDIMPVTGFGNENRSFCAIGRSGATARNLQILIRRILPSIQIYSWQEVDHCSP